MSNFTMEAAANIASLSFRNGTRGSKPLCGKEAALFAALQRAESAHDAKLNRRNEEFEAYCRDREMFEKHEEFYQYFREALKYWRAMKDPIKKGLISYTQNHLQTIEHTRNGIPLARLRKRCDDTLEAIALAAHQEAIFLKGRRSGTSQSVGDKNKSLRPLYAFGSELKAFWKINVPHVRFGQQFDGEVPLSAASKLILESAKLLKVGYKPANIQSVMRMLASNRRKRFLEDEFMIRFRGLPDF
jgi:hypothetical protein